jgi:hypothetical protein
MNRTIGLYNAETDEWVYREMTDEEIAEQTELFATMPEPQIVQEQPTYANGDEFWASQVPVVEGDSADTI